MRAIRSASVLHGVPCITTIHGAQAAVAGIESVIKDGFGVQSLQDFHKGKN
jgi:carbamoyl-phosphate synthase large subunit